MVCVDVPECPGRVSPILFTLWGHYSSDSQIVTVLNLEPKSPNPANRFEKQIFEKKCQTWTALPDNRGPREDESRSVRFAGLL